MSYSIITKKIKISKNLLFPLLDITKTKSQATFIPKNTYLWCEDLCGIDCLEFGVLYDVNNPLFENFEKNNILPKNPMGIYEFEEGRLYVFDVSEHLDTVSKLLDGEYSKFDEKVKSKILSFWGVANNGMYSKGNDYKIILYPEKYIEDASQEIGVPLEYLKKTGELLSKINKEDETFRGNKR